MTKHLDRPTKLPLDLESLKTLDQELPGSGASPKSKTKPKRTGMRLKSNEEHEAGRLKADAQTRW